MSQDDLFGAPAGWYPDPLGLPQLRWWNNHAWTEQTSAARQPMVMQDTKFAWADDELPTRREERERERQHGDREPVATTPPTAETLRELAAPIARTKIEEEPVHQAAAPPEPPSFHQPDPVVEPMFAASTAAPAAAPSFGDLFSSAPAAPTAAVPDASLDALFGSKPETRSRRSTPLITAETVSPAAARVGGAIVDTASAWIIAMIPLLQLVVAVLLLTALGMGANSTIFLGILVVPYFLAIVLAIFDHRALKHGGHEHPAHWAWALLTPPVYLLLRARSVLRQTGHGFGPLLVWAALGLMHVASILAVPGLLISVLPTVFTAEIAQSIETDAMAIAGKQMEVTCPAQPPVLVLEQTVCTGIDSNGAGNDITVQLARANGWISWQVLDWGVFSINR